MKGVFLLLFTSLCLINLIGLRRAGWATPIVLFVLFNFLMGAGIIILLDFEAVPDFIHGTIIVVTSLIYLISSLIFTKVYRLGARRIAFVSNVRFEFKGVDVPLELGWYLVAAAATFYYFHLAGYNVLVYSLRGADADFTTLRLGLYSGNVYYAPGYFNQFKNVILPCVYIAICARLIVHKPRGYYFAILILALPVLYGLLGTGQRAFLAGSVVVAFIFFGLLPSGTVKIPRIGAVAAGCGAFALFSLMSYSLGRVESGGVVGGVQAILKRVFFEQQYGSVAGFRYIYDIPVQHGLEWSRDLLGILPGFPGSDIAHRVHGVLYGSERGTVPISLWSSVFLNFGWLGVFLFPMILAWFLSYVTKRFYAISRLDGLRLVTYSYAFFVLGSWVSSGPMQLINNGLVTVLIMNFVTRAARFFVRRSRA